MKSDFYKREIEKAKPILTAILSNGCSNAQAEKILQQCELSTVCTIQLMMYMGRDAQYKRRKKTYQEPLKWFINFAKYMDIYACTDKDIEIDTILMKRDYKVYIANTLRLMRIRL